MDWLILLSSNVVIGVLILRIRRNEISKAFYTFLQSRRIIRSDWWGYFFHVVHLQSPGF